MHYHCDTYMTMKYIEGYDKHFQETTVSSTCKHFFSSHDDVFSLKDNEHSTLYNSTQHANYFSLLFSRKKLIFLVYKYKQKIRKLQEL